MFSNLLTVLQSRWRVAVRVQSGAQSWQRQTACNINGSSYPNQYRKSFVKHPTVAATAPFRRLDLQNGSSERSFVRQKIALDLFRECLVPRLREKERDCEAENIDARNDHRAVAVTAEPHD